jgi:hypothetical protein
MRKNMFITVLLLAVFTLLMNSSTVYSQTTITEKLGKQVISVDEKSVTVEIIKDKGRYVVTCSDPNIDKTNTEELIKVEEAINSITTLLEKSKSRENNNPEMKRNVSPLGYTSGWDKWVANAYGYMGNAKSVSQYTVKFDHPSFTVVDLNASGSCAGYWLGSSPYNATFIILTETLTVSGTGVTVSWPPSFSQSGTSASYVSQPFYNTWIASSPYSGVYARSYVALYSYTQSNQPQIRIGNIDYRPTSSIYTNWLTGECDPNPNGSYTHTYGY